MDAADVSGQSGLADRVMRGDRRAVARAISIVEDAGVQAGALMAQIHPHTGRARLIGVTGPPGAGKSTLVGQLIAAYRRTGVTVAVLAIDPSSPFTGGAILGDRLRMRAHGDDPSVFIRSMATRGHAGGLAAAAADASAVLDAAGFDLIFVETVGVGQDEVDIVQLADTCVVVSVPGTGDDVQALKAGLMEAADVFVVNKADREGADEAAAAIAQMIAMDERPDRRRRPVVRVVATQGHGIDELVAAIDACGQVAGVRDQRRRERAAWRLRELVVRRTLDRLTSQASTEGVWKDVVNRVASGQQDPYAAAERMLGARGDAGAIDHIAVATDDIDATVAFFQDTLGMRLGSPEDVPSQGVRVRFVETGDTRVELIEATDEASPLARSLRARGSGLHHIAVRVADLDATLERLAAAGVALVDRAGRPGAHGTRVAFVHPSSAHGVLVELVERPGTEDEGRAPR